MEGGEATEGGGWTFKGPGASCVLDLSCEGWEQKALSWSSNVSRPQL